MSFNGMEDGMRDTGTQRAIREAVNARLSSLEKQVQELIRFCPPSNLSTGRNLLARAAQQVKGARIRPGEVAAWVAAADEDAAGMR